MDIEKLSKLAGLKKEDVLLHKKELVLILDAFKQIKEVNTGDTEPTSISAGGVNKHREDVIVDIPDRDAFFENAPELSGKSFKVPFKL